VVPAMLSGTVGVIVGVLTTAIVAASHKDDAA
jgi:hypothetical protein